MKWIDLTDDTQLATIAAESKEQPVVIFKHSTRCSISSMAKNRLDREADVPGMQFYYLDLIRHRALSNAVAELYQVVHESPQVLLIRNGECIYDESHNGISLAEIEAAAK